MVNEPFTNRQCIESVVVLVDVALCCCCWDACILGLLEGKLDCGGDVCCLLATCGSCVGSSVHGQDGINCSFQAFSEEDVQVLPQRRKRQDGPHLGCGAESPFFTLEVTFNHEL